MPPVISRIRNSLKGWWSKKTPLEKRVLFRSTIAGVAITLCVVLLDMFGTLDPLELWLYDRRAADCQYFNKPPTDKIVHIDIDDASLDIIGRWPWPRSRMAQLLDELALARPKAVLLDVIYSEPDELRPVQQPDGSYQPHDSDLDFAASIQRLGCVLVPLSVKLAPPRSVTALHDALVAELTANLELSDEQATLRLRTRGFEAQDVEREIGSSLLRARHEAMAQRLVWELDEPHGPTDFDSISRRLLPHTDIMIGTTPLLHLLEDEYKHALAEREARRLAIVPPKGFPSPVHTTPNLLPVAAFSRAAQGIGFADHDLFPDPVVRALPLLVEENGRLFPQFGVALGLTLLDADLTRARVQGHRLIVPTRGGADVTIPFHAYASRTLRRDVPLIADIPWFGTGKWEAMYDHPKHVLYKQHLPISMVWSICEARDSILTNNRNADKAIDVILTDSQLDAPLAARYAKSRPPADDWRQRAEMIKRTIDVLDKSQLLQTYAAINDKDLKPEERLQRDQLKAGLSALQGVLEGNPKLAGEIARTRDKLASAIRGKGVLIGSIATAAKDDVTTSIHARCPGVVVHGVIANAVLTGQWWTRAPVWVEGLFAIALGLATALAVGWTSPPKAAMVASGLAFFYLLLNGIALFDYGNWIVGASAPLVAVCASWAGCSVIRQVTELIERVRVAQHLAVFRREMELAKRVQVALIPKSSPKIRGIESHGWTLPADITGGDCFDLWQLSDGRLGILLADASGHGLAPSMIVSQVRTLVRAMADLEPHPHGLLARVNARLADDLEAGRFVTAFAGYLDSEGNLTWASAGHGPVLWCQGNGNKKMVELESSALPLGIQQEWLADDPAPPLKLAPGGLLIVMSDGIFEAPGPTGEQFGVERCLQIFHDKCDASSVEIVAALRESVRAWQAKDVPVDDQTTVVVRRVDDGVSVTVSS
jgi:serine phosphatase RsbU (regulator of sigma subunit)/CHASE2 domain-containing sensor protein